MASGQFSIGSGVNAYFVSYSSNDSLGPAQAISGAISAGEANGSLTATTYTGTNGAPPPAPASAASVLNVVGTSPQAIPLGGYGNVVDTAMNGPTLFQGGAPGEQLVAGSGSGSGLNVSYTNITPSGTAVDNIAITGGNNYVQTSTSGGGNYVVNTGNGNDTVNILTGNGTINPGTGYNVVNLGTGSVYTYSEGYDTITGSSVAGGGTDTVNIGSGSTSINSGYTSFLIQDSTTVNPLLVTLGLGTDTIQLISGLPASIIGQNSSASVRGVGQIIAGDTATGDTYTVTGALSASIVAGKANETINGASATGANAYTAGSGNDTLIAGLGADTLTAGKGNALLQSGTGSAATTFSFINTGAAGGSDTISGFKANDIIQTVGYGPNPGATAITTGNSTIVTLSDGTTLTINGVVPAAGNIRSS